MRPQIRQHRRKRDTDLIKSGLAAMPDECVAGSCVAFTGPHPDNDGEMIEMEP